MTAVWPWSIDTGLKEKLLLVCQFTILKKLFTPWHGMKGKKYIEASIINVIFMRSVKICNKDMGRVV